MLTMLVVEYGAGAETADYDYVFVRLDGKHIIKEYGSVICELYHLIWFLIPRSRKQIKKYPYGYASRTTLDEDLKNRRLSI